MPVKNEVVEFIQYLNELLEMDRVAIQELMSLRVVCNQDLADHPTVQVIVGTENTSLCRKGEYRVGLLGLMNGYFGSYDDGPKQSWGAIAATYDNGLLVKFEKTQNE